jgi:hypothetical protein
LDFVSYDLILGMDWLEQHSPMTCDWLLKWIQFEYQGTLVKVQGILPSEVVALPEISSEQLHKLAKGNDIWAMAVVMTVSADESKQEGYLLKGIPKEAQEMIRENSDLFATPKSLPPHRVFDLAISMLPKVVPVNNRPFRYSPE